MYFNVKVVFGIGMFRRVIQTNIFYKTPNKAQIYEDFVDDILEYFSFVNIYYFNSLFFFLNENSH